MENLERIGTKWNFLSSRKYNGYQSPIKHFLKMIDNEYKTLKVYLLVASIFKVQKIS